MKSSLISVPPCSAGGPQDTHAPDVGAEIR
jgi:hypothetical protein